MQFVILTTSRFHDGGDMLQMKRNGFIAENVKNNAANNSVILEKRTLFFSGRKKRITSFLMIIAFLFSSICAEVVYSRNILRIVKVRIRINRGRISIRSGRKKRRRATPNSSLNDVKPSLDTSLNHKDNDVDETENWIVPKFVGDLEQIRDSKTGGAIATQNQIKSTPTPTPTPTPEASFGAHKNEKSEEKKNDKEQKNIKLVIENIIFAGLFILALVNAVWHTFIYFQAVQHHNVNRNLT
jgi:hypothetical protein